MAKQIQDFTVQVRKQINQEYFILEIASSRPLPVILPGQFAEVHTGACSGAFLRRPISFYDVDYESNEIRLLIAVVGRGTAALSKLKTGDNLNMIYPLGNHFSMPQTAKALLVGGGVGVAPLLLLGKYLRQHNIMPTFLLGYRNGSYNVEPDHFSAIGTLHITTEDGSLGYRGLVTDHPLLSEGIGEYGTIYTCGPVVMMKAVSEIAARAGVNCEASLENTMACGFGACLCCAQATKHGHLMVCTDGPVFNTADLIW